MPWWRDAGAGGCASGQGGRPGTRRSRQRCLVGTRARAARACRAVGWAAAARRPALSLEHGHAERARLLSRYTCREDLEWASPWLKAVGSAQRSKEDGAMSSDRTMASGTKRTPPVEDLPDRDGCGPIGFAGDRNALYERHLTFLRRADLRWRGHGSATRPSRGPCETSFRQRWLRTEQTYASENAKRVYYLSMEFLDRALPRQQHHEPAPRSGCQTRRRRQEPRLACHPRGRA